MKVSLVLCIVATMGCAYCGVLPAPALVRTPSLDSAVVTSERLGGNFAYSTVENHAYTPVAPVIKTLSLPVTYAAAPIALRQSIFQGIYGPPLLNPGIISSPIFGGVISQTPIFGGQAPIFGQGPILGQAPIGGQVPIQGQYPIQSPVQPPQNVPQADVPLQGDVVDEDTVSVDAAI